MALSNPAEVNSRTLKKRFFCPTCKKSIDRIITPGAVTFFNFCTLTEGCRGTLVVEPNAKPTSRANITWKERNTVTKSTFTSTKLIKVAHLFESASNILVDLFLDAYDSVGNLIRVRDNQYMIVETTPTHVVIQLPVIRSGIVILTDTSIYTSPVQQPVKLPYPEPKTLLSNNILTVAINGNLSTVNTSGLAIDIEVKKIQQSSANLTTLSLYRHYDDSRGRYTNNVYREVFQMYVNGERFWLYSTAVPSDFLERGTNVKFIPPTGATAYIMLATADKEGVNDIYRDKLVPFSQTGIGNITGTGVNLIVSEDAILSIDPPLMLI